MVTNRRVSFLILSIKYIFHLILGNGKIYKINICLGHIIYEKLIYENCYFMQILSSCVATECGS